MFITSSLCPLICNQSVEYVYDKNGNLIKDLNKKISNIEYNFLNLPSQVSFADGSVIEYEYGAAGNKLRTVHTINGVRSVTDYCDNAVYENGSLKMLLNESGYVSFPDKQFHYYVKDHQGNVRVVADKDGNVEETNTYYPFGGTFTSTASVQPYKYNGKELDRKCGLDWYDYGARMYDAALGRFVSTDPAAEKYYFINLYAYCLNTPVKLIDLTGEEPTYYEAALMAKHVYGDKVKLAGGWQVSSKKYSRIALQSGFKSVLYERKIEGVTEYTLATAGTELTDTGDLKEDIMQLWGETKQYDESITLAQRISLDLEGAELTFVGHSLGGGLAAANALVTDKNAITFNPAAITSTTKLNLGLPKDIPNGKILNIIVKGEIVDYLQSKAGLVPDGTKYELKASYFPWKDTANTYLRVKNHSIDTVIKKIKDQLKTSGK